MDAAAFEQAMARAVAAVSAGDEAVPRLLDEALALYRGPFLEGEFEPPEILSGAAPAGGDRPPRAGNGSAAA